MSGLESYVENYSQVGDIIVVGMCILFLILIRASFVNRTRSFHIFCVMLVTMAVAAYSRVILYVFTNSARATLGLTIALRIIHYSALFANLFLFIFYFVETLHIDARESRRYLIAGTGGLIALISYMVIGSYLNVGFFQDAQNRSRAWMQVFTIGYLFFVGIVLYLSLRYRGRIYRQVSIGVLASSCIAFFLLLLQSRHAQSSYTTASFLFPAVALLYLVHANPYDLDIGAVNISGFEEYVRFYRKRSRELLMISLLLPGFDGGNEKYPADIQQVLRHFTSHYFRGAVLFQVSNGRMVLTAEAGKNPNYEESVRKILEKFEEIHLKQQLDYKIVITTTLAPGEESESFNYIELIQYVEEHMPVNTVRRIPQGDIEEYRAHCYIVSELADINAKCDRNDERVLVYCQPVLNLRTGRYDTAEALMRLKLDKLGLVTPNRFIPLAEEYNYITALSMTILSKTCAEIRRLLDEGYEVKRISVNFSMLDLRVSDFSEQINRIIRESGIPSGKVAIELTESQNERDFMLVKERISELHESGIKFYLDDFGTGYSNFDRIMELPFDIIKFDRSLVIASGTDAEKRTMVSYLARMFSEAHYSVLYEGVETESDQERCTEMSARYLQGYKFSPPIPIERLREYFEAGVTA